jgi:hypothetical protein
MKKRIRFYTLSAILLAGFYSSIPEPVEGAFLKDYLIWDAAASETGNNNSGPKIDAALKNLGFCGDYAPVSANTLINNYTPFDDYAAIFICLGIYPDRYVFGNNPGDNTLADSLWSYLSFTNPPDTPHIYMEGGDTWVFDSLSWTVVHPFFKVDYTCGMDGFADLDFITGVMGTCMEELGFQYSGENNYIDRLCKAWAMPPDTAVYLFENGPDSIYYCSVGYRPSSRQYVSIGSSFEFGGVDTSLQLPVMDSIMCFFEMESVTYATDVAATRIVTPGPFEPPESPLFPQLEVKNLGQSTETFDAFIKIDTYTSSVTVSNLPPDSTTIVTFPDQWITGDSCTTIDITCWVELPGDLNSCNDRVSSSTFFFYITWVFNSPFTTSPPTIDGYLSPGEWIDAEGLDVSDILDKGGTGAMGCNSAWMYVMNDSANVYFAIDANAETSFDIFDTYTLFFDDNNDEVFDSSGNEGRVSLVAHLPAGETDTVYYRPYNPCRGNESVAWTLQGDADIISGHVQYELQIPLNPTGPDAEINASPGDTVGMWINVADGFFAGRSIGWWCTNSNFNWGETCPDASLMCELVLGYEGSIGVEETPEDVSPPSIYSLLQNRPNPTSWTTEIRYGLPFNTQVNLSVYDITGRIVVVIKNELMKAGHHSTLWDGKDARGKPVGSGVYFYRLKASDFIATKKMVILR